MPPRDIKCGDLASLPTWGYVWTIPDDFEFNREGNITISTHAEDAVNNALVTVIAVPKLTVFQYPVVLVLYPGPTMRLVYCHHLTMIEP